jgi:hypothetical protein
MLEKMIVAIVVSPVDIINIDNSGFFVNKK